jgi:hypothetical protein
VRMVVSLSSLFLLVGAVRVYAGVPIVTDGTPIAVIVTADKPGSVAEYAAEELVTHIEKATGARLPVLTESGVPRSAAYRIYVGDCQAASAAGIMAGKLPPESFVLKTAGDALFIVGEDGAGDPLAMDTRAGTLWGAYEWLEQSLKVRWLWPGELGTYVPKARTIRESDVNETTSPRFLQRKVRSGPGLDERPTTLGFTPARQAQYIKEQTVFLRRHRMGRSRPLNYRHAFVDWWDKYGQQHPEWFQLLPNGRRGPNKAGARFSMCVSNPGLQREIVDLWKQAGGADPKALRTINACENDILGLCDCSTCKAWDGNAPADFTQFYAPGSKVAGSRFVSDRYARFWLSLQQLAAKENPEAIVVGYVYFNYFVAPTTGIKLNRKIWLGFCPSGGMYPRSPEEHAWMKRQWSGWAQTGASLFARTNYFLDGYCMPHVFAHQFADEFRHAVRSGIIATDFDSLTGQWSTQGTNLYLLARLHVRPDATADELLGEYYQAFGAAAPHVKAYFDYWEKFTMDSRERINAVMRERQASRWRSYAKAADGAFPPAAFPAAEAILQQAAAAAGMDREAAARVEFLRKGLEHAKLCVRVASLVTAAGPAAEPEVARKALEELVTFRRKTERDGIANFSALAWSEGAGWNLPAAYR